MLDNLISKVVLGWARHFIGIAAGGLVAHGYLSGAEGQELAGALMTLIPLAFSAYDKWHALQAAEFAARTGVAPGTAPLGVQ